MEKELRKKTKIINNQILTHLNFVYNKHIETKNPYFLIININSTQSYFIQLMANSLNKIYLEAPVCKVNSKSKLSKAKIEKLKKLGWGRVNEFGLYTKSFNLQKHTLKDLSIFITTTLKSVYGYKFEHKLGFEIGYQHTSDLNKNPYLAYIQAFINRWNNKLKKIIKIIKEKD